MRDLAVASGVEREFQCELFVFKKWTLHKDESNSSRTDHIFPESHFLLIAPVLENFEHSSICECLPYLSCQRPLQNAPSLCSGCMRSLGS